MGVYLFDTAVLRGALRARPVNLVLDVLRPLVEAGERVMAYEFQGYWEDVGTVGAYYRANLELVAPEPRFALLDPRWPILTRDEERPPAQFRDHAVVEESLVANGSRVDGTVRRSVLFSGVVVERGAEIVESVILPDVHVGAGARVERAIVDKYARVGAGAQLGAGPPVDSPETAWLEGLTLVGKDAVVPPGARVGRSVVIGVGARPTDYENGELPAGSAVPNRSWFEEAP
jgi:glucose-1-phosphate adenylyltransferase